MVLETLVHMGGVGGGRTDLPAAWTWVVRGTWVNGEFEVGGLVVLRRLTFDDSCS